MVVRDDGKRKKETNKQYRDDGREAPHIAIRAVHTPLKKSSIDASRSCKMHSLEAGALCIKLQLTVGK